MAMTWSHHITDTVSCSCSTTYHHGMWLADWGVWLARLGKLYIFKNGSRMKAEGNYKDGDRPFISNVLNTRRHLSDDGKLYLHSGKLNPCSLSHALYSYHSILACTCLIAWFYVLNRFVVCFCTLELAHCDCSFKSHEVPHNQIKALHTIDIRARGKISMFTLMLFIGMLMI